MSAPVAVLRLGRHVRLRVHRRSVTVGLILLALAVVVGLFTLGTGDYPIPVGDVVRTLLGGGTSIQHFVIETLRLPRLLTAFEVGAALAIGGALFQSLSRNPLGSPDVVGFDTGAATGALVVLLVLHRSGAAVSVGAVVGGVGTALAVYLLAMRRGLSGYRLILVGIGLAAMLASVNSYLLTRADVQEAQSASFWLVGSLNNTDWRDVVTMAIALAVLLPAALWVARGLRELELGEDTARGLGVSAELTRVVAIVVGVGLSAVATASAGPIGFVALAAPQVARRLTRLPGPGVLPAAVCGALVLSASDYAAQRGFGDAQLPVGVTTGVVGGLYLAWLLGREWKKGRG
ncbi:MAG: iron chelate uptake ABC transporter family permease subunit [Nocardioides sp.]|uniref:FecCD family ABC transporter permease n=1 Tax=Nocardioides sp. TaxID=35761 RepID=UPI0039E4ED13